VIRDKKSAGNSYSAAGDDDINDVAAMGGVNLQEEANVSVLYFIQTRETGFYEYQEVVNLFFLVKILLLTTVDMKFNYSYPVQLLLAFHFCQSRLFFK